MQQYTTDMMIIGGGASPPLLQQNVFVRSYLLQFWSVIPELEKRYWLPETVAATLGTFQQIPDIITVPVKSTGIQL